ncbi:MAG TPA: hypothetical protein VHV55_07440 [Pirellulales bacterium]|jgi:hypothetical protein|nr:hypothetical protein [Pirellulales bacterium]
MRSTIPLTLRRTALLAGLLLLVPANVGRGEDPALRQQKKAYDGALATLANTPDNRAAHQVVGRYLCLVEEDWKKGLEHLAAGPDGKLKELAAKSLQAGGDAAGLATLAHDWSSAADKAKAKDQALLRAGAAHLYSEAIPRLNGQEKALAEKRLAEVKEKLAARPGNREKVAAAVRPRAGRTMRTGPAPNQLEIERAMAQRVISLGGKVQVYQPGQLPSAEIDDAASLPAAPFLLYGIDLTNCSNVVDKDLEGLEALSGLIELQLSRTKITDTVMPAVANSRKLERLLLDATAVTDAGAASLRGLIAMRSLSLHNTKISDAALANLVGMQQLARFAVNQTKVTDAGVQSIAALRALRTLNLSNTDITDAGLPQLARLPLVNLHLEKTKIDDQGVQFLASMSNLGTLDLTGTAVSQQGLLTLRARLPGCQITQ